MNDGWVTHSTDGRKGGSTVALAWAAETSQVVGMQRGKEAEEVSRLFLRHRGWAARSHQRTLEPFRTFTGRPRGLHRRGAVHTANTHRIAGRPITSI